MTADGSATQEIPDAPGDPRQVLSYENTRVGSVTMTIGDRSRTCDIDIVETYDPEADTFTIEGPICGREVSVTREHRHRPQSSGPL